MIDQEGAIVIAGASASAMTLAAQVEAEKSEVPLITNSYADGIVSRGYKYTFKLTPQGSAIWNWSMTWRLRNVDGGERESAEDGGDLHEQRRGRAGGAEAIARACQDASVRSAILDRIPDGTLGPVGCCGAGAALQARHAVPGGFTNDLLLIVKALRGVGATMPIFGAGPAGSRTLIGRGWARQASSCSFFLSARNWDLAAVRQQGIGRRLQGAHPTQPDPPGGRILGQGYVMGLIIGQALEKAASRDRRRSATCWRAPSSRACPSRPPR